MMDASPFRINGITFDFPIFRKYHKHIVTERLLGIDHGAHDRDDLLDPDKYTSSTRNKVLKSFGDPCSFHFHVDES